MTTSHDEEIRRRYIDGDSTLEIAEALGLRVVEVIGRIRELDVQMPGMDARPRAVPVGAVAPSTQAAAQVSAMAMGVAPDLAPCSPLPVPQPPSPARATAPQPAEARHNAGQVETDSADDPEDDDCFRKRPNCPKGWLMTEAQVAAIFARASLPAAGRKNAAG